MTSLLAFIVACMLWLTHGTDPLRVAVLATAISHTIETEGPLFKGPDGAKRTAVVLVSIAYRESNFRLDARGDKDGISVCAFQIMGGSKSLLTDADACTLAAYRILRASVQACGKYPIAAYAAGRCSSVQGRRISNDRMALAERLLGIVVAP